MPRNTIGMGLNSGERLDTMEGYDNNYGEEDDKVSQEDNQYQYGEESDQEKFYIDDEKLLGKKNKSKTLEDKQEKIEVNMDEIEDDDDQECLLDYNYANSKKSKTDDD